MPPIMRTRLDLKMSSIFGRVVIGGLNVVASVVGTVLYLKDCQNRGRKDDCVITKYHGIYPYMKCIYRTARKVFRGKGQAYDIGKNPVRIFKRTNQAAFAAVLGV